MSDWRAECAKHAGPPLAPIFPSGAGHAVRATWIAAETADAEDLLAWGDEKAKTRDMSFDGRVYSFNAKGVRMVDSGEIVDLGRVQARCIDRAWRGKKGHTSLTLVRTWRPVGGGKFDIFEMTGLPPTMKEVSK